MSNYPDFDLLSDEIKSLDQKGNILIEVMRRDLSKVNNDIVKYFKTIVINWPITEGPPDNYMRTFEYTDSIYISGELKDPELIEYLLKKRRLDLIERH